MPSRTCFPRREMKAVLKPNSLLSQCGAGDRSRIPAFVSGSKPWRPRGFLPGQVAPAVHAGSQALSLVLAPGAPAVVALSTRRCRPLSRRRFPPEPSDPGPLPSQRRTGGANSRRRRSQTRGPFQETSVRGKLGPDLPGLGQAVREGGGLWALAPQHPNFVGRGVAGARPAHLLRSRALPFPSSPASLPAVPRPPAFSREWSAGCRAHCLIAGQVSASLGP